MRHWDKQIRENSIRWISNNSNFWCIILGTFYNALIQTSVTGSAKNFKLIKVQGHKDAAIIQSILSVNTLVESLIIIRLERYEVNNMMFDSKYALNIMNPFARCPYSKEVRFREAAWLATQWIPQRSQILYILAKSCRRMSFRSSWKNPMTVADPGSSCTNKVLCISWDMLDSSSPQTRI